MENIQHPPKGTPLAPSLSSIGRVDLGGYPPRSPTDPDVRISRIRFLRGWSRYAPCAIRWSGVETLSEIGVTVVCLSIGSILRRPLPSTRSLGSVPPLPRYYEALRLPDVPPASLRFLRLAVPQRRPSFRSRRWPSTSRLRAWVLVARLPNRNSYAETAGSPRFLGEPL